MTHEQLIAAGWTCEKTGAGCAAYIRPGEFINVNRWDGCRYTAAFQSYLGYRTEADNDGRCYSTAIGALADLGVNRIGVGNQSLTVAEHCCGVSP